jgi:hypothetical protein
MGTRLDGRVAIGAGVARGIGTTVAETLAVEDVALVTGADILDTRNIALAYAPHGARAAAVWPAGVDTGLNAIDCNPGQDAFRVEQRCPLGRIGPQGVARVVAFRASDDAAVVRGSHVIVDGAIPPSRLYQP